MHYIMRMPCGILHYSIPWEFQEGYLNLLNKRIYVPDFL